MKQEKINNKKTEKIKKNDFIEIVFTASIKGGEIFDSNIKEDVEKMNLNQSQQTDIKPFIFCLGHDMFLKGVEDFLIGKQIDVGKTYEIELSSENAFGKRNPSLIKIIPTKIFLEKNYNPQPGMMFNFDGALGRILSVSGGRVITDFNNPLAGKDVVYKVKVLRKVSDINEKVKALMDFFFKKEFPYEIQEKEKKLIIKVKEEEKQIGEFMKIFKDKFKEMLDLELDIEFDAKESKLKNN